MYTKKELKDDIDSVLSDLKKRRSEGLEKVHETYENIEGSFWTRSKAFQKLVKWAFKTCDSTQSGAVTKGELYTGLLLVYIRIARYAGPAACYPPSREVVDMLFDACDSSQDSTIEEEEFKIIMVVLTSQLTWRIASYYALIITLVPYILSWTLQFLDKIGVDETFTRMDSFLSAYAPFPINKIVDLVPDSVWVKLPESILAFIVFSLALPYFWSMMDNYLEGVAVERNATGTCQSEYQEGAKVD